MRNLHRTTFGQSNQGKRLSTGIRVVGAVLLAVLSINTQAQQPRAAGPAPAELLTQLAAFPHAQTVNESQAQVLDYEIGLGAMQKVGGAWRLKHSERISGLLTRNTWQIVDGFSSREVMDGLEQRLAQDSQLLYACDGRSCGPGAQWANRVFRQRLLYGREDLQAYRVYGGENETGAQYRVLIFSAARTADRQYLHAELLQTGVQPDEGTAQ